MRRLEHGERHTRYVVAQIFAGLKRSGRVVPSGNDERRHLNLRQQCAVIHVAHGLTAGDIAVDRRRHEHLAHPGDGLWLALAEA